MPQDLTNCPHERRPGTTVCLHCRHAERLAARAARAKMFSHVMVGGAILGVIAVVASAATAAFDGRQADAATAPAVATAGLVPSSAPAPALVPAPAMQTPAAVADTSQRALVREVSAEQVATVTPALTIAQPLIVTRPAPAAVPVAPAAPAARPLIPMVPEGTSPLADSMTVVRRGDTMLVHFDTELGRTRRPEKFDAIVRATLVQIYGSAAESMLSTVAPGTIARDGDLLADLPARGIRMRAADGTTLALWPITRPGRDGPLVVSYRATVLP